MSTLNVDNITELTNNTPYPVVKFHDDPILGGGIEIKRAEGNFAQDTKGIAIGIEVGSAAPGNGLGFQNTVIGNSASKRDNGFANTVLGYGALAGSSTVPSIACSQSVAIGVNSLGSMITSGVDNTAVGHQSGRDFKNGVYNTMIGAKAGSETPDANYCTLLGWGAGGTSNVFPYPGGTRMLNGNNVTCIGFDARPSLATISDEITLGNGNIGALRCNAPLSSLSDARDKKDVKELGAGLDFIKELKPVEFVWNDRENESKRDVKDFGFIAQDLKKSQEDAELADTLKLVYEANPDKLEVFYGKLVPILVKAIQELTAKVEVLEKKVI
jgi:hypothetical protein